ncbi:MAG: hypothetical protein J6S58_08590, partial [Lentisphaeria bacterium]|nr:hypothetical protein [Lentisphaeria bacterium]
MNQQIFFLGSATDPARSLAQHLCCDLPPDNELGDLSDILVILPGKQARRSVMRELASFRRIMLIPSFITVSSFRRMGIPANRQEPSLLEKKILWME